MKVLMVTSWYSPKDAEVLTAGVFHYEQSMALKPYCDVALYFPYDLDLKEDYSKKYEKGLLTYRTKFKNSSDGKISQFLAILEVAKNLKKVCDDFQPDIIHAHCAIPAGFASVLFGKIAKCPVVITEHFPIEQMHLQSRTSRLRRLLVTKYSDANICVSKDSMDRLQKYFPTCKYQVIYNGIIHPETLVNKKESYRINDAINCCIVAGFYSKEIKGYQYLLPAIQRLKQKGIYIVLHIVGGGEYFEYYRQMATDLEIEDCSIFYGNCNREKVYNILSQMDFSISASIFECSGVSVQEAMLLGKPLVVTKSGGANSLVTNKTAIVVDRHSMEALVEGIEEMSLKFQSFDAEEIKQYAVENFEIDRVSCRYMDLYQKILKEKSNG